MTLQNHQHQLQQPQSQLQNRIPMPSSMSAAAAAARSPKQQQRSSNLGSSKKSSKIPNGGPTSGGNSRSSPCGSPKRSPKLMRAASGATEIKDYGMIDQRVVPNYPPHAFPSPANGKFAPMQPPPTPLQQQQQQLLSKIPNPSRLPMSGLQKPSAGQPQLGLKMPKMIQNPAPVPDAPDDDPPPPPLPSSPANQARSCSLPRQKRDEAGPSNVAVVSPMPNSASTPKIDAGNLSTSSSASLQKSGSVDETEPAKSAVPVAMAPIGLCGKPENSPGNHFMGFSTQPVNAMTALVPSGQPNSLISRQLKCQRPIVMRLIVFVRLYHGQLLFE